VPRRFVELYGAEGGVGQAGEAAAPLVLSSLNTHENRLAVLHFTLSLTAAAEVVAARRPAAPSPLLPAFRHTFPLARPLPTLSPASLAPTPRSLPPRPLQAAELVLRGKAPLVLQAG